MATYKQSECNFCGSTLRFEISKTNELVNCHDCGMETILFLSDRERPYPEEEFYVEAANVGWSKTQLGFRNVVGVVVNNSRKDFDWVRIEFTLVNREALPIGSTSDCLIHFPVNAVWCFRAPVFQSDAVGVGTPLISCEYGKIIVPKQMVQPALAAPTSAAPPVPAPLQAPPASLTVNEDVKPQQPKPQPIKRPSEWTGLRITGGITGVAHKQ